MADQRRVSTEEMLALREQGLTNAQIAEKLGVSGQTVLNHIGKQPEAMTRANRAKVAEKARRCIGRTAPVETTPVEPQNAPSEPLEAEVAQVVEETVETAQGRQKIETGGLFEFAFIKDWQYHLQTLARLAKPEPWCFADPEKGCRYPETQILENYICATFKNRVSEYNENLTEHPDTIFYVRDGCCCFHTGLYTSAYMDIYACFEPNRYSAHMNGLEWFLRGFYLATDSELVSRFPLPENRSRLGSDTPRFDPIKSIHAVTPHIVKRNDGTTRLPDEIASHWNVDLLVETAIELARRMAAAQPETVVTVSRPRGVSHLLPLYMTNPDTPDVAAMIIPTGEGYVCQTVLTLNQAYLLARTNGRPTANWLTSQVEHGGGEPKGVK